MPEGLLAAPRPTRVRHLVVGACTLMAVLLYLDRFCVGFAADFIREDLGLTQGAILWFHSAFFWSYALAQVPSGWLSDRYGARAMLSLYILSWSFFTAMVGLAQTLTVLILMRLGIGLGQAGAYPTSAGVVSKWVPFSARGSASAVISFGGRVGGALAPLLTAYLIVLFVPLGTPASLTEADLLHAPRLGARLLDAADEKWAGPSPQRHVWTRLPEESREVARRAGEPYREVERRLKDDPLTQAEADELRRRLDAMRVDDAQDREALLAALNGLIDAPELLPPEAAAQLPLNDEARRELRRLRDGESLSSDRRRRYHRFLLESAFPGEIRKLYVRGWRPVMLTYGLIGIVVAGVFWAALRNRPEEHPACNEAERELIAAGRPAGVASPDGRAGAIPWGALLRSGNLWLVSANELLTNVGWAFLVISLPRYLLEAHQVPLETRGLMASVPLLVGIAGMLAGGWITDAWTARLGLVWGRRLPMCLPRFTAALGYALCLLFSSLPPDSPLASPWAYVAAFALVAFSTDMGVPPIWAFKQDVGGRYAGTVLGWGNMWGNLGAAVAPPVYHLALSEHPGPADWNTMFLVCLAAFLLAGVCSLWVDATKPVVPSDHRGAEE